METSSKENVKCGNISWTCGNKLGNTKCGNSKSLPLMAGHRSSVSNLIQSGIESFIQRSPGNHPKRPLSSPKSDNPPQKDKYAKPGKPNDNKQNRTPTPTRPSIALRSPEQKNRPENVACRIKTKLSSRQ